MVSKRLRTGGEPVSDYPWGDTCPLLKIARHFGVDYAITLHLADALIHGRDRIPDAFPTYPDLETYTAMGVEVGKVVRRFNELRNGA